MQDITITTSVSFAVINELAVVCNMQLCERDLASVFPSKLLKDEMKEIGNKPQYPVSEKLIH